MQDSDLNYVITEALDTVWSKKTLLSLLLVLFFFLLMFFSCNPGKNITGDTIEPVDPITKTAFRGLFPKFPHNIEKNTQHEIIVLYSPDDLFSTITWDHIGYPDSGIFLMHNAFPKLKVTMQLVPENRYVSDEARRNIQNDPVAAEIWRRLFYDMEYQHWLEFGNHGYHHSPQGDTNLDNHEFNGAVNPDANDFAFCNNTFKNARKVYEDVGLDNDKINIMRFPGNYYTNEALHALVENEFISFFTRKDIGHAFYIPLNDDKEILAIPDVLLFQLTDYPELIEGLESGTITNANLRSSSAYKKALVRAEAHLDQLVLDGGVINFFDHWWEHCFYRVNGVLYRAEMFLDLLKSLDKRYGPKIWWGFGSKLGIWNHIKRNFSTAVSYDSTSITIDFSAPDVWKSSWDMEIGYIVTSAQQSDFPEIDRIEVTHSDDNYQLTHKLMDTSYWVQEDQLFFNFTISGSSKVRILFKL